MKVCVLQGRLFFRWRLLVSGVLNLMLFMGCGPENDTTVLQGSRYAGARALALATCYHTGMVC